MIQNKLLESEISNYVSLAKCGYYPLFYTEWLSQDLKKSQKVAYTKASKKVREIFEKLGKHRGNEKKQTYLLSLSDDERTLFIQSFYKVVEHNILSELKEFH